MKRSTQKGSRRKLWVAVSFLACSCLVAGGSLLGWFGGAAQQMSTGLTNSLAATLGDDPVVEEPTDEGEATAVDRDLLAEFGSFDRQLPVRLAFAMVSDLQVVAAAPAGETMPPATLWKGEDPPALKLGVLLVSEAARRAVVNGVVVGVGDGISKAIVFAIERDAVQIRWSGRLLTYDFDGEYPREFRAEQARRTAAAGEAGARGEARKTQEDGK